MTFKEMLAHLNETDDTIAGHWEAMDDAIEIYTAKGSRYLSRVSVQVCAATGESYPVVSWDRVSAK